MEMCCGCTRRFYKGCALADLLFSVTGNRVSCDTNASGERHTPRKGNGLPVQPRFGANVCYCAPFFV